MNTTLPRWADVVLVPLISLVIAFLFSALLIWGIGQSPVQALSVMIDGSLASTYGFG